MADFLQTAFARMKLARNIHRLFFSAAFLYGELLVYFFNLNNSFLSMSLVRIFLLSVSLGLFISIILDLIPNKKVSRGIGIAVIVLNTVYLCVEHCCYAFFKTYFSIGYMGNMLGEVVGSFSGAIATTVLSNILFILLSAVPLITFVVFRKEILPKKASSRSFRIAAVIILAVLQLSGSLVCVLGKSANLYTYDFSSNVSIPKFGALTSLRLELQYSIFGKPKKPIEDMVETIVSIADDSTEPKDEETVYGYNVTDIDFESLISSERDSKILSMHKYFSNITPSQQNEYTGYFKGKNLILITAEAFSPYVISEDLTPTLYKLSHEGFVFNNYYQPNWTQSTTGGEFAVMTGIVPTWVKGGTAFVSSGSNNMTTSLGWLFKEQGYNTLAYHNNTYTYYDRDKTHPNLGYSYYAVGNGLELPSTDWPASDLEMLKATTDGYIKDYLENGTNFHTYYMTVSGHANYSWSANHMSKKNREAIEAAYPDCSEQVQAYLACNLELEYAMSYLVEQLENAGIADETVIVLTADHYPYALAESNTDYYVELSGIDDKEGDTSRYKNTLIMWSKDMEEAITVDTPCSSIDIVPTLCNLFGLEYDSRLYSGRDVFAQNYKANEASTGMPLVVFANYGSGYSWITAAGTYEASTDTFTSNEGITVSEDYVSLVSQLVKAKFTYAEYLVEEDYYNIVLNKKDSP